MNGFQEHRTSQGFRRRLASPCLADGVSGGRSCLGPACTRTVSQTELQIQLDPAGSAVVSLNSAVSLGWHTLCDTHLHRYDLSVPSLGEPSGFEVLGRMASPDIVIDPLFNHQDADIIVRSTSVDKSGLSEPSTTLFRVHTTALASLSTVFSDMCKLSQGNDLGACGLPEIQMDEQPAQLSLFLSFFYEDILKDLELSQTLVNTLIDVWEMADKYHAPVIAYMVKSEIK